jgi:hypothetical protein
MMRWKTRVFSHFKFEIPNLRFLIWNSGIKTACFKSQIKFGIPNLRFRIPDSGIKTAYFKSQFSNLKFSVLFLSLCLRGGIDCPAGGLTFERIVIDADFPGGYQVEVADVNGDGRPDVVGLGGGTCAWFENPTWKKRVVSSPRETPGIISSATADLDGDGKAEIAIAYEFVRNEPTRGELALASQEDGGRWRLTHVAHIGSIHRLRWGDVDGDKTRELVAAPLFGRLAKPPTYDQDNAQLVCFHTGANSRPGRWRVESIGERPVVHAIEVHPVGGLVDEILTADNLGVAIYNIAGGGSRRDLIPGAPGTAPKRGSSEVHLGKLKDGRAFLATIDPWHGNQVAVCLGGPPNSNGPRLLGPFGPRSVIDATLADGHALWVADVDGDGDDEVFAGHRGADHRVSAYDFNGTTWDRTVIDRDIAAQDLRGGDLDGDGTPDVVAIGGQTHNVVWYRPKTRPKPKGK